MSLDPDYQRAYRARLHAERVQVGGVLVHPRARHGTKSAYCNWGCRCRPCKDALAAHLQAWRASGEPRRAT